MSVESIPSELLASDVSWSKYFNSDTNLSSDKFHNYYNVLIIGQSKSGKTSLMKFLKTIQDESSISELIINFEYLNIDSEDSNAYGTINIWVMDDIINLESLIEISLTPLALKAGNCMIIFLIDLSKPHTILNFLNTWIDCIKRRLDNICTSSTFMGSSDDKTNIPSIERIPIIILGNQNDSMEQIFKTSQHPLSTIMLFQYQLRNWALKYHSSIMFISCKTGENLDLFKSYLIYIAFNATATIKPNLSSFKSLFIPFEYDSIDKIEKLKSEIKDLNISHNISDCFELNQTNDNISYYDIKYQAIPNDKIKIIIEECLIELDNNKNEKSFSSQNLDIINNKIVANKIFELNKLNNPTIDELKCFMDDRIQHI